ncbi:arf6 guanine nucleotide exchange factor [Nesidiocoris tenuis]|uniref:Arf6 guanine nucleotide exchange factor n=1 Tax=Nesidiocoris tenuis TaxID=355587 RepID=A0ABN7A778_9HEMI|nr:arf6 guanine nucleotide exchange factor [Nesidiocoris tenuis]
MAEELLVVLNKKDPTCGLGFSLLGTPGLPPIIYEIVENSPAAESGKVEPGDVILKVNETEVNRLNTKEVLKCLRLCENPVSLILKRDPIVKDKVRHYLSIPIQFRGEVNLSDLIADTLTGNDSSGGTTPLLEPLSVGEFACGGVEPPPVLHPLPLENVTRTNGESGGSGGSGEDTPNGGSQQPKFEAYVMTGDRVLKICRTQQGSVLPKPPQQRKVDSIRNNMHAYNNHQRHASVPTSPVETERHPGIGGRPKVGSASTSPTPMSAPGGCCVTVGSSGASSYVVRTSKSEDHLQSNKDSMSAVSIDIDDDVTSSLNTLLDTRQDSETEDQRIVWTYNAPNSESSSSSRTTPSSSSNDHVSPPRPDSPASPTSVSSSVMTSSSSSGSSSGVCVGLDLADRHRHTPANHDEKRLNPLPTDLSQSEAISNISSPDFQEEDSEIIAKDLVMEVSDPSDSDSTLLVSDHTKRQHRIVIQVAGRDKVCNNNNKGSFVLRIPGNRYQKDDRSLEYDPEDEEADEENLVRLTEGAANLAKSVSPPPVPSPNPPQPSSGEEDSDVESLHSYHYSPKGVDMPSAVRLAKRLYMLDGFKKSDVSRHLSKNNEFSRAVAEEYLKYFTFTSDSLDAALRKFLTQFCLTGETQERERVLVHFSKRYLDCNPGVFTSQDAVHTLTCAIMLLNTDMHGQTIGRKMTCNEFIENLAELNDGENFPREILKNLYQSIKNNPLEWAIDDESDDPNSKAHSDREGPTLVQTGKVLFDVPSSAPAVEYKKGYVMRKCCVEPNGKKTPLGKRGWKMYYCTLRDMVLYLHKDEHGFRKTQLSDNLHNAIRIHHSLATKANDYTKKLHVFRLETADQAVYLFQTSDSKELQSWIDTINYVTASFSAPPLPGAVGSQKKFQRPLLPSTQTRLNLRDQLRDHENMVQRLETELDQHRKHPPERGAKQLVLYNFREKDNYLQYELKRYKLYVYLLRSRMSQLPDMIEGSLIESIGESAEEGGLSGDDRRSGGGSPASNRVRKEGANGAS